MTITTRLYTFLHGKHVGNDAYGNRYFTEKKTPSDRRQKRWVIYNGQAEPSKVPPPWHNWLHYTSDVIPGKEKSTHHNWEKPHLPNLTGTVNAYLPKGHLLREGRHAHTVAKVEPWQP